MLLQNYWIWYNIIWYYVMQLECYYRNTEYDIMWYYVMQLECFYRNTEYDIIWYYVMWLECYYSLQDYRIWITCPWNTFNLWEHNSYSGISPPPILFLVYSIDDWLYNPSPSPPYAIPLFSLPTSPFPFSPPPRPLQQVAKHWGVMLDQPTDKPINLT